MSRLMTLTNGVALVVFLFPLAYSPGPGNAFFAGIGATAGVRAALLPLAGYHLATFAVTVLIGFGLGEAVLRHPVVADVLTVLGAAYVLWLAWQFFRSAHATEPSAPDTPTHRVGFWSGAVVLLLNPKAYYIIATMFTQFLRPSDGGAAVLTIATLFTLNNLVAFLLWTWAGRMLARLFRSERSKRWIAYLFAAMLLGVAVWMLLPFVLR